VKRYTPKLTPYSWCEDDSRRDDYHAVMAAHPLGWWMRWEDGEAVLDALRALLPYAESRAEDLEEQGSSAGTRAVAEAKAILAGHESAAERCSQAQATLDALDALVKALEVELSRPRHERRDAPLKAALAAAKVARG
jgi:hypothetical protein